MDAKRGWGLLVRERYVWKSLGRLWEGDMFTRFDFIFSLLLGVNFAVTGFRVL